MYVCVLRYMCVYVCQCIWGTYTYVYEYGGQRKIFGVFLSFEKGPLTEPEAHNFIQAD